MRCQRCGFEMEQGQTFCSMCGTEQSRALREKKKSKAPKSILWVIKVASKGHFKMWMIFIATLIMSIFIYTLLDTSSPLVLSSLSLSAVLLIYELFYILLGYKNPNSTKTKAYKIKYRMCGILAALLLAFTLFLDFGALTASIHEFITNNR
jgi:hypothetical protein